MWHEHKIDVHETLQRKEAEEVKGHLHGAQRGKAASSRYLALHGQHSLLLKSSLTGCWQDVLTGFCGRN